MATFFLSVRGDEDAVRKQLAERKLPMVGEPCTSGNTTTTVRVNCEAAPLRSWLKESASKTPGDLLSYQEDY